MALKFTWNTMQSCTSGENVLDKDTVNRIKEIQVLPDKEKEKIYSVIDALIRDYKTKKAYS